MDTHVKEFLKKVKNRQFAVENCCPKEGKISNLLEQNSASNTSNRWTLLEENLEEADINKIMSDYYLLTSHRTHIGKIIVFLKRAVRKLLCVFLGWYLHPIYQKQSLFNCKMLNVTALEREIIAGLEQRLGEMETICKDFQLENKALINHQKQQQEMFVALRARIEEKNAACMEEIKALQTKMETICKDLQLENKALIDHQKQQQEMLVALRARIEEKNAARMEEIKALHTNLEKLENLPTSNDDFYHHFEEKFRGARADIKNRLQIYVPLIKEHLADWSNARFIDIGSGRGEWLDILKDNGATDYVGVDLNQRQNAIAESYGHKTICRDCIAYLAEQPDNSVDLISGIQLIEHLYMSDLMELLKQSYRVLKKGGMILFETPNPRNISVAAYAFYNDPSHKRPLDPGLMSFLADWSGFGEVKCIDANSSEASASLPLPEEKHDNCQLTKAVNDIKWVLFGPMDYALFAVKE